MSRERWSNVRVRCNPLGQNAKITAGDTDIEGVVEISWNYTASGIPILTLHIEDADIEVTE